MRSNVAARWGVMLALPAALCGGAATVPVPTAAAPLAEASDQPNVRVDDPTWKKQHADLVALAQKGGIDLYLLGDSQIYFWNQGEYRGSYTKYFSGWKTGNFGVGGDRTEHVLWRIKNGELDGVTPKVIVLQIGTNNLSRNQYNPNGDSPEQAAAGIKAILAVFAEKQPQAKVLLVSVFPRDSAGDAAQNIQAKVKKLNGLIAALADGKQIVYLDIYNAFLNNDGKFLPGVMLHDNLHLVSAGYDIWGEAMKPILTKWLGAPELPPR